MDRANPTSENIAEGHCVNLAGAPPSGDSIIVALPHASRGCRVASLHYQVADPCQSWRDSVQRPGHWASVKRLPGELFNPWRNACGFYPQDVLGRQRKLLDAAANLKMVNAGQNRVMQ
jgi:hypothetical protein